MPSTKAMMIKLSICITIMMNVQVGPEETHLSYT